jgi:hypothetical protein
MGKKSRTWVNWGPAAKHLLDGVISEVKKKSPRYVLIKQWLI